jgi:hypothetical protein
MANKQTAVDFLYEFVLLKLSNEEQMQFEGLFQQAKQMEKEQMIEFADKYGFDVCHFDYDRAEQYYDDTYGNN